MVKTDFTVSSKKSYFTLFSKHILLLRPIF